MPTRYLWEVRHGLTVDVAVRVNGITLHHGTTPSQDGITAPADHLLQPGENVLEVEVRGGDPAHGSAFLHAAVRDARTEEGLATLDWPADFPPLPPPAPPFPTIQLRPFRAPDDHPRPIFVDAEEVRVPPEGNDEVWAPIQALQAAFSHGDGGAVAGLFAARAAELHRFHDLPETSPAGAEAMARAMVTGPYEMAPLYGGLVYFRGCAGGRAVQLLRLDGQPAILGRSRENPKQRFFFNPVLVRVDGAYRIVG